LNEKNFPNCQSKFETCSCISSSDKKTTGSSYKLEPATFLEKILNFNFIENFLRKILKPRSENKKNKIRNNY